MNLIKTDKKPKKLVIDQKKQLTLFKRLNYRNINTNYYIKHILACLKTL